MDEFSLQRKVFRSIISAKPATARGMADAFGLVCSSRSGAPWKRCTQPDWTALEDRWVVWLKGLLANHPMPRNTQVIWIESPSELNPAMTSISAFPTLNRADETFGLEDGRTWPEHEDGTTLPAALLMLPELDTCFAESGWRPGGSGDDAESLRPGVYALTHACATLLAINGLPRSGILASIDAPSLAVTTGWASGDVDPVGMLSTAGWKALKRDRSGEPSYDDADPNYWVINFRRYIKLGRDPNWRDPERGIPLLMKCNRLDDLKLLIKAEADPKAVDKDGRGMFHRFGAGELPFLRELLKRGVSPHHRDRLGSNALDQMISDGRCSASHLQLFWKRGVRPDLGPGAVPIPIKYLAQGSGSAKELSRKRAVLRFWLARKLSVNGRTSSGRTPIWLALEEHASELIEHRKWLRNNENLGGVWDYAHDAIAILLLEHGADPNARLRNPKCRLIPDNATPLMVQRYDDDRLVRALLKHGADPLARCAKGKTALDYARAAAKKGGLGNEAAAKVVVILEAAVRKAESARKNAKPRKR